jgi:formylglycine-generating enzyme required for sulfatase activity
MQQVTSEYVLGEQIGYGSLGSTFLAEHGYLKRPYIVKVLPPELQDDPAFIQRFEAEVEKLAALDHPHIARIHTATRLDEWGFVLVTERHPGLPVDLTQGPLPEEQVEEIALQLATALDYAHSLPSPLAHGGIKLSNVLVDTTEGVRATLTDFGLLPIVGPLAALSRTYAQTIRFLGAGSGLLSPGTKKERYAPAPWDVVEARSLHRSFYERFCFLAPEQRWGDPAEADLCASDRYAFGVLLYALLTGELPTGYGSPLKKSWESVVRALLHPHPAHRPRRLVELLTEREEVGGLKPSLRPQEIQRPTFDADPGAIFQTEMVIAPYRPEVVEEARIEPLLTEMAVIPGGSYLRGSLQGARDEMPRHAVTLNPFALDIHPVTNEQFVLFLEAIGGEKDSNNNDLIRLRDSRIKRSGGKLHIESGYHRHPAVGVTWYGAVAYAKWVGKRLPTEAEWEVAACGGDQGAIFPSGHDLEKSHANFFSSDTTAVMSYAPTGYGLYDMAGNVYEWCQDWYDYHFYNHSQQEPHSTKGPAQGVYRVLRGGCWKSSKEDLRCAHRHRNNPGAMNGTYGFRCAADVS